MTTIAPAQTVKRQVKRFEGKPRPVSRISSDLEARSSQEREADALSADALSADASDEYEPLDPFAFDDDPTEYPDFEAVGREPVEHEIVRDLEPVIIRYQAQRGIKCYVGSDAFMYWAKGDNTQSVSPDIYVFPGLEPTSRPQHFKGHKDEGCWKTWIHNVVPNFALEVKAWRNPRKDELQSPPRHDALGTKELIVFDPFHRRRRKGRKRFVLWRRNAEGKLVIVQQTNGDRVFSEQLDAFLVAQGDGDSSRLRIGLDSNGERLLPFESELVDMEAQRANEQAQRANEEAQRANEQARRADEQALRADEQARRADEQALLRQEEVRRADEQALLRQEEARRADEQALRAEREALLRQEEARRADEQALRAEREALLRQEEARRADDATRAAQEAARRMAELEAEVARLRTAPSKRCQR